MGKGAGRRPKVILIETHGGKREIQKRLNGDLRTE